METSERYGEQRANGQLQTKRRVMACRVMAYSMRIAKMGRKKAQREGYGWVPFRKLNRGLQVASLAGQGVLAGTTWYGVNLGTKSSTTVEVQNQSNTSTTPQSLLALPLPLPLPQLPALRPPACIPSSLLPAYPLPNRSTFARPPSLSLSLALSFSRLLFSTRPVPLHTWRNRRQWYLRDSQALDT